MNWQRRFTEASPWLDFSVWPSESLQVPQRLITANVNGARDVHGACEAPRADSPFNRGENKLCWGFKRRQRARQKLPFSQENTQKSTRAHLCFTPPNTLIGNRVTVGKEVCLTKMIKT